MKILVLDADYISRRVLQTHLSEEGHQIHHLTENHEDWDSIPHVFERPEDPVDVIFANLDTAPNEEPLVEKIRKAYPTKPIVVMREEEASDTGVHPSTNPLHPLHVLPQRFPKAELKEMLFELELSIHPS